MKILLILFLLIATNASAGTVFIRDDGGIFGTECDGSVDKAKSADKKCAVSEFESRMIAAKTSSDNITIIKGAYIVSAKLDQHNITMAQFIATPKLYTDAVAAGKKVNILNYNGRNFELILK